jgi:transcriptional regulator with XRE-family HTH domain
VFDIGASLAAARETRGLSLADAERLTCIRGRYLGALERSDFAALPGRAYGRAFLRTYAQALGLEADRFVAAYEEIVPEPDDAIALAPLPRRRRSRRIVVAVAALAAAAGVVAWAASLRTSHPLPSASSPPSRQHAGVLGSTHTRSVAVQHRHGPAVLVLRATRGDCWLLVRRGDSNGAVLYEGTLRRGSTVRFAAPRVWVRLGAPGMVDASRGGKAVPGLSGATPLDVTA